MSRSKLVMVVIGVGVWASIAQAATVIEIAALTPENAPGGYLPETTVDFEVSISADNAHSVPVRLVTLDFSASSPELVFTGPDDYPLAPDGTPLGNGIEEFVFEFGTVMDWMYWQYPDYPVTNTTYSGTYPIPGLILELPMGGSLLIGTGSVVLPESAGTYGVDGVSGNALVDTSFDVPDWRPVTGDPLLLTVVPEPGTLVLLVAGGLVGLARRRARNCRV